MRKGRLIVFVEPCYATSARVARAIRHLDPKEMRHILILGLLLLVLLVLPVSSVFAVFDHQHRAWTALLAKHVVVIDGGNASRLNYSGIAHDRAMLAAYLDSLSRVTEAEFKSWSKTERLAFLINAYNAHMVELVLTRYPDIQSVWDFGKIFNNPFKSRFFKLFGHDYSLDMIEHETIRVPGAYDEPRIHFAVNCASIGCPMLRAEAYVGERLAAQLEDQTRRFLSDRRRNRYDPASGRLEISEIFRWYGRDFEQGYQGIRSVPQFLSMYASDLAASPEGVALVRAQTAEIRYLPYDWELNDVKRRGG